MMVSKVEGTWEIHYVIGLLAQLEARGGVEADPGARDPGDLARDLQPGDHDRAPRMQGMSFGPADLAA